MSSALAAIVAALPSAALAQVVPGPDDLAAAPAAPAALAASAVAAD